MRATTYQDQHTAPSTQRGGANLRTVAAVQGLLGDEPDDDAYETDPEVVVLRQLQVIHRLIDPHNRFAGVIDPVTEEAAGLAVEDALAFSRRDPAKHADVATVILRCRPYRAVLVYRFAHALYERGFADAAAAASDLGTMVSGVEFHFASVLGRRCIVDHGFGSRLHVIAGDDLYVLDRVVAGGVVGETVTIGDDCTVQLPVLLGAGRIGVVSPARRQPTLGDGVVLAGGAKVLGPVTLGDRVFVAGDATVMHDVAADARIGVRSVVKAPVDTGAVVGANCVVTAPVPAYVRVPDGTRWA